jgi:hypothetical protein
VAGDAQDQQSVVQRLTLAWKHLLALVRKPPWDMTRADIESYRAWLDERKLSRARYATTSHIHMFYSWCSQKAIDPLTGPDFNPAAGICTAPGRL